MKFLRHTILSWSRLTVLAWTSLWMLAVPLFHVHPDADHLHGQAGHLHGGTVHTVMSSDLECETESHPSLAADSQDVITTVAGSGHRHLEIEFSLLTDSDRKSYSFFSNEVHALISTGALNLDPSVSQALQAIALFSPMGLIHDLPSRGPPTLPA